MKPKSRLGRGLSSLMSGSDLEPAAADEVQAVSISPVSAAAPALAAPTPPPGPYVAELPLDAIVPNPHQPRRTFDEAALADLAASLRSTGLIQPIVVRKTAAGYELIAGERRWRAARIANLPTVPCIVRDVDGFAQAQMALVENIHRQDLNPIDRAVAYRQLISHLGLTQAELAGRLGEDRSSIANYLRLLDLTETVQTNVREGKLSIGHAKLLAGVDDAAEQERLATLTLEQGLSVRNLERLLQAGTPTPAAPAPAAPSAHLQDLEKSLSRQLGLRVQVRATSKKGRGRLILHYGSLDQFDDLMAKLGAKAAEE